MFSFFVQVDTLPQEEMNSKCCIILAAFSYVNSIHFRYYFMEVVLESNTALQA